MAGEKVAASVEDAPREAEVIPSGQPPNLTLAIEHEPQHPQQVPPDPANDREPAEEPRIYARGPTPAAADPAAIPGTYTKADPSTVAAPDRERFYDVAYRGNRRNMIDHAALGRGRFPATP